MDPTLFHRVRFFTSNGDGTYSPFRDDNADFNDQRGSGYRLNDISHENNLISQETFTDQIYTRIQDILDVLRSSREELRNTRIASITSPYSIRAGSLLPFMTGFDRDNENPLRQGPGPIRQLLSFTMPATRYMQIHVMLDPLDGGRKRNRKTRRKSRRKRR